jgi:hypothetical protein
VPPTALKGLQMLDDADIKIICECILSNKQRCDELMDEFRLIAEVFPGSGPIVSADTGLIQLIPLDEALAHQLLMAQVYAECNAAGGGRDIETLAMMPSATLLGCRAKASVLALIPDDALSASLVADVLMVVKDVGSKVLVLDELSEVQT